MNLREGVEFTDTQDTVSDISSNPNQQLGFEITPPDVGWTFIPEYYPESFTQMKKKELNRYGGTCEGESVSIKSVKNREFHATGLILQEEIPVIQSLMDYNDPVDLVSPLTKNGGMECFVKSCEIGEKKGWNPHKRQWFFKYTIDLVSTGRDEYDSGKNAIVTAITDKAKERTEMLQKIPEAFRP